ncbi:universal stress protein [Methanofollis fontis]|uniref:Universal stress protein n=1 Tax=Methanofollis fontis TaxID=2052832 RepID=A0A483CNM8_9EURY|nr:universal stress protein [Methanofollis fontis]TAJ44600.1 hypothetical protein CUJ86_04645 [Methanofollis fontis]
MGYFTSLLQRKFKDVAGKRYETVVKEYREFLLTEEEMMLPEIHSILMPLDYFVQEIPPALFDILSAYEGATVSVVYIIDMEVIRIVEDTLDEAAIAEFRRKREAYGNDILDRATEALETAGLTVKSRMFSGKKFDHVIQLAGDHDLIAVSKRFAATMTDVAPVSPVTMKLAQMVTTPMIVY